MRRYAARALLGFTALATLALAACTLPTAPTTKQQPPAPSHDQVTIGPG